ncbi:MAG: hypothetical protein KDB22_28385, partial [Planctomycetales bacterium]|nr:hypothetical protein [Planctomycetales bacterium]
IRVIHAIHAPSPRQINCSIHPFGEYLRRKRRNFPWEGELMKQLLARSVRFFDISTLKNTTLHVQVTRPLSIDFPDGNDENRTFPLGGTFFSVP